MVHAMLLAGAGALALSFPHPAGSGTDTAQPAAHRPDIVDTAVAAGDFTTLVAAVQAAGLVETLKGPGPFTVLAPTDAAFARLPKGALQSLLQPENRDTLREILTYHVIPGSVDSGAAVQAKAAKTVQGEAVAFRIEAGRLKANNAAVVANDVLAGNGIIHAIDTVLMPPKPIGRLVIGFQSEAPGAALAAQLDLDPHKSLVITKVTKGSEAQKAGLMRYDVLVTVDGKPATQEVLVKAKDRVGFGGTLELRVIRRGEPKTLTTRVGAERKK